MMTTVAIVPIVDARGRKPIAPWPATSVRWAKRPVKTWTLTAQLEPPEVGGLLFIQAFNPMRGLPPRNKSSWPS